MPLTLLTRLRPATLEDADVLLRWRNDPEAVLWSQTGAVDPIGHQDWLISKLSDPLCTLCLGEVQGQPVGMLRVERQSRHHHRGTLSVAVGAAWRGRGIAWQLLDWSMHMGWEMQAVIHEYNLPSRRLFVSHGFTRQRSDSLWLTYTKTL